jgi:hypothetical protein
MAPRVADVKFFHVNFLPTIMRLFRAVMWSLFLNMGVGDWSSLHVVLKQSDSHVAFQNASKNLN